jgi:hypothetical protein
MGRVSRYGKPHAVRFKKVVDKALITFCIEKELNESDVIQEAVECFLMNHKCSARKRLM